jgi:hypothetical protein
VLAQVLSLEAQRAMDLDDLDGAVRSTEEATAHLHEAGDEWELARHEARLRRVNARRAGDAEYRAALEVEVGDLLAREGDMGSIPWRVELFEAVARERLFDLVEPLLTPLLVQVPTPDPGGVSRLRWWAIGMLADLAVLQEDTDRADSWADELEKGLLDDDPVHEMDLMCDLHRAEVALLRGDLDAAAALLAPVVEQYAAAVGIVSCDTTLAIATCGYAMRALRLDDATRLLGVARQDVERCGVLSQMRIAELGERLASGLDEATVDVLVSEGEALDRAAQVDVMRRVLAVPPPRSF